MVNTRTLQQKLYKPRFELLENSVLRLHKPNTALTNATAARGGNPELGIFWTGKQVSGRGTPPSHQIIQRNSKKKKRNPLTHSTLEWCGEVFVHDQPPPIPNTPSHQIIHTRIREIHLRKLKGVERFFVYDQPPPHHPTHPHHPFSTKLSIQDKEKSTYA